MAEQSDDKSDQTRQRSAELSMTSLAEALTSGGYSTQNPPSQSHSASLPQYQQSGQYQQSLPTVYGSQSLPSYGPTSPQQYPYVQQLDQSQVGYYAHQAYRSSSMSGPSAIPQPVPAFNPSLQRMYPQGQNPPYQIPRYDYQQPQQYSQTSAVGRAMSYPSYGPSNSSPRHPPSQFVAQTQPYPIFSPAYLQPGATTTQIFPSDDNNTLLTAEPENLLPRGPPRKPKQSGFALWVGNLPRDVPLQDLKEFFAIDGLESIFLIRKSNCAFVNYKTEEDCAKALTMFNDRLFMNVRLVCRLRKSSPSRTPLGQQSSSEASANPTPPSDSTLDSTPPGDVSPLPAGTLDTSAAGVQDQELQSPPSQARSSKERYFILKSLTKEDLMWSVTNKVWATQPHNESILNEAFKTSENVYLIFSVNKSGEFFGYARMASEIQDTKKTEASQSQEPESSLVAFEPPVQLAGPKITVTPRTSNAPRGKIFEDEVRGTVFWEIADSSEDEDPEEEAGESIQPKEEATKWGNPFCIEWIKWNANVQFSRTRLLRNPWNGNREVKISRDGTELEPSVGTRLLKEFDNESPAIVPAFGSPAAQAARRMTYPNPTQYGTLPSQLLYPQQTPVNSQGVTYVPYTSPPQQIIYGYPQRTISGLQPSQPTFGQPGQQYPHTGQPPPPPPPPPPGQ